MLEFLGISMVLGLALATACGMVLAGRIEAREEDNPARLQECSAQLRARLETLRRSVPDAGYRDLRAALDANPRRPPSGSSAFA